MCIRDRARTIGVLPQSPIAPEGITAGELVARGRYPHQPIFGGRSSDDDAVVAASLAATDAASLTERRMDELSGGQLQRVCIARAVACSPEVILFDEAISSLDAHTQVQVMDLLRELKDRLGLTYIFITHDLTSITYLCDDVLF